MQIIQFSDTHLKLDGLLYDVTDTERNVRGVIDFFKRLTDQPDMYVVSGDLADFGRLEAYERLNDMLNELPRPVYVLPGNHDDRDNLHKVFKDKAPVQSDIFPFVCYEIPSDGDLKLLVCDTHVSHQHWGTFSAEAEAWLKARLETYKDKPVLVFTHHVPFRTNLDKMDEPFVNADRFVAVLQPHRNVKLCTGHMHTSIVTMTGSLLIQSCPAVSMQMEIDTKAGGGWRFYDGDPGYVLHDFIDGRVNSHTIPIPLKRGWSGPWPFEYGVNKNSVD
ncbi:MAG: metallophosphoesterase [Spirochaetaceae bacterium]|jgi:3',5'-cyclic AMP phosphodiesterase CpdA|nr:metallophosphoesterase [Spirochaetaceae bacterium]